MNNLAELFKEFTSPSFFKRIDSSHPLNIYIGRDKDNLYALEFRGNFKPKPLRSSTFLRFNCFKTEDNQIALVISLADNSLFDNFCVFCNDIIESCRNCSSDQDGFRCICDCYFRWRKLFQKKSKLLDENEIMGLIGELLFLKDYLFENIDYQTAISSWTGWDKTHKDFSYSSIWYEIKSVNASKNSVKISSVEQLSSSIVGFLVVFKLEKMSPTFDGIKVNKLATEILNILPTDEMKEEYLGKLSNFNFSFDSDYDDFVYDISRVLHYRVENNFPRLTRDEIPNAIIKAQYEISLSEIDEYLSDLTYGS